MLDQLDILEIALRGGAAGLNLLMAALLLVGRPLGVRRALGALFALGTAAYVLVSTDHFDILGPLESPVRVFAIYNTIFFWWFARSLFEDVFVWDWVKLSPFALITVLHAPLAIWQTPSGFVTEQIVHGGMSILMLADAIWIALRDRNTDLVGPRRRFRLVFALLGGAAGIIITLGENLYKSIGLPEATTFFHAVLMFALTFFFVSWLLSVSRAFFAAEAAGARAGETTAGNAPVPSSSAASLNGADKQAFDRLTELMDDGVYREEGLTVPALAEKVGIPEHQLRRLINRELGFRNFTAFLNARRIEEAKAVLADPANARRQVLQIALDLGYASVAPFNRAFKQATGQTPTEYRKAALGNG